MNILLGVLIFSLCVLVGGLTAFMLLALWELWKEIHDE